MTQSYVNGSNDVVTMTYRSDGLRVTKANAVPGNNANKFTHYRYEGQMGVEDVEVTSGGTYNSLTRYALGARGVDAISRTTSSGTGVSYPLYDAHGNNIGLIAKTGSSWSISDERSYDTWGQVRNGGTTGDQKGRYCAGIGHKQDDESGLIYMRARYYEPTSGRFLSEDSAADGLNWYSYCANDPVNYYDRTGKYKVKDIDWIITGFVVGGALVLAAIGIAMTDGKYFKSVTSKINIISGFIAAAVWGYMLGLGFGTDADTGTKVAWAIVSGVSTITRLIASVASGMLAFSANVQNNLAISALVVTSANAVACIAALACLFWEPK